MFELSVYDLFVYSGIGKRVTVILKNKTAYRGVLKQIQTDFIVLYDLSTKLNVTIDALGIAKITFEGLSERNIIDYSQLSKFRRSCEKKINENDVSLGTVFSEDIQQYRQTCENDLICSYLNAELSKKATRMFPSELEVIYSLFKKESTDSTTREPYIYRIIEIMMLMRMRRFDKAFELSFNLSQNTDITVFLKVQYCLFAQIRHYLGVLFWLEKLMSHMSAEEIVSQENTWWYYLKLCVRYSNYEKATRLIGELSEINKQLALNSLAYLLIENGSNGQAIRILEYSLNDSLLSLVETNDIISKSSGFLISDSDNNYHRYLKCINTIISNGSVSFYKQEEDIFGYIYDFVPDREYGFILGFDLLPYFFRVESIRSDSVTAAIRQNICSFLSIREEQLVFVTFRRSIESKRAYNAIEIV